MLTLLHFSDIHFGPYYLPTVGEALLRAAHDLEPDIIINSGDLTQRAKRAQYQDARVFLDRLPRVPTVVVPGNHDVPLYRIAERIATPYGHYRHYIAPELDTVLRHERAVIVALNSTSPLRAIVNGRIRRRQIALCERTFAAAPADAVRIVVAHHHFAPAPDYQGGDIMPGAKRAIETFAALDVELIFGGHLHRAYIGNSLDVHPGRERRRGIIIVQAGTAASRRGRAREKEKNSFNLVRVGSDITRITHYMYFEELDGFAPVSRHIFPRSGHEYLADTAGGAPEEIGILAPPVGGPALGGRPRRA